MFRITREACEAVWRITSSSITLQNGSCSGVITDQAPFTYTPSPARRLFKQVLRWTLSELPLGTPTSNDSWHKTPWKMPMYTATVGAMWWSNLVGHASRNNSLDFYPVQDQVTSSRPAIKAKLALYVVLATQPALLLAAFAAQTLLYSTPLNHGFGLVSILAGVDPDSLHVLKGASLSGKLRKKVGLKISVRNKPGTYAHPEPGTGANRQIQYFVDGEGQNGLLKGRDTYD